MDDRAFLETLLAILSNHNRKAAFLNLCDLYEIGTDEQRKFIRKNYPFGEPWKIPHIIDHDESYDESEGSDRWPFYSDLPSNLPDEAPAVQRIRASLIWLSIKGGSGDIRDDGLTLILIYYAAKETGMDTAALFAEIAALSGQEPVEKRASTMQREQMGYYLRMYNRNDIATTLEHMGFARLRTPYGIRFSPIDQSHI